MDKLNSERAVHSVADALNELDFKNYIVVIEGEDEEFDAVFNKDPEKTSKLLLEFLMNLPDSIKLHLNKRLVEGLIARKLKQEGDD